MAKAIYALKLNLYKTSSRWQTEFKGVTEICIFVALVYAKAWYHTPSAEQVPSVDLVFLQDVETLQEAVIIIVAKGQTARKQHYLSEALAGLAFFDK